MSAAILDGDASLATFIVEGEQRYWVRLRSTGSRTK